MKEAVSIVVNVVTVNVSDVYKHALISHDSLFKLKDAIYNLEKEGYEGVSVICSNHTYIVLMKKQIENK